MQLSELFRRGVVAPLDDEAETQMRGGSASEFNRVRWLEIASPGLFEELWRSGIIQQINQCTGSAIDEFEETILEKETLHEVCRVTRCELAKLSASPILSEYLRQLHDLADEARASGRPVFFVL